MRKTIIFLAFALTWTTGFASENFSENFSENSGGCYQYQSASALENIENHLDELYSSYARRTKLLSANMSYGFVGVGIGSADILLDTTDSGEILQLSIKGQVGILGVTENIRETISLYQLKRGKALNFYIDGVKEPRLKIVPSPGFNEYGGKATLHFWNGKGFDVEEVILAAPTGEYAFYQDEVANGQKIMDLKVRLGGMSLQGIKVKNYKLALD